MPAGGRRPGTRLPWLSSVLAVVAHPDDESFGLGAVLSELASSGTRVGVLCLTRGGASTLGAGTGDRPLGAVRAEELAAAAAALGVATVRLLDHPDGRLSGVPTEALVAPVEDLAGTLAAEALVALDVGGVTGHPDHERATQAALAAATGLPVLAWAVPEAVARQLNAELGTTFVGRGEGELDYDVRVDRSRQLEAIACHASQAGENPVLWRRLALLGDREVLRWLRPPPGQRGVSWGTRPVPPRPGDLRP